MSIGRTFSLSLAASLLVSCSPPSSSGPGAPVDLAPSSLSPNGCLDLASAVALVRSMPADVKVRINTTTIDVLGDNLRRNFIGEATFSNFRYEVASPADASLPDLSQTGCESVAIRQGALGETRFAIAKGDDPAALVIERPDGARMEWRVTSPRSLRVESTTPIMDRCPTYDRAKTLVVTEILWGRPEEITALPSRVTRAMLRSISTVVLDMPAGLLKLATFDPGDEVEADSRDLALLMKAKLDPETQDCPYRAEPPSTTEPPPPPAGATLP